MSCVYNLQQLTENNIFHLLELSQEADLQGLKTLKFHFFSSLIKSTMKHLFGSFCEGIFVVNS